VGYRSELAAVDRLLDRVASGGAGHLVVTGPPGAGKSTLIAAAADAARTRGIDVSRVVDAGGQPRLFLIDDIDRHEDPAALIAKLSDGVAGVLATARDPLGIAPELRLKGLTGTELSLLLPDLTSEGVHAVWLASAGLPGPALDLAALLAGLEAGADPVAGLALSAQSSSTFLDLDMGLVRLLEAAARRPLPPAVKARVLARLARELLGDPEAKARREELMAEALTLARAAGGPGVLAEVLESGLHARWDPAAAQERLETATRIVELAREADDGLTERRGLFWRFTALAELGDLAAAETVLTAYARAGDLAGDATAAVIVLARQAMLSAVRGRFDQALALADEVAAAGRKAGLADTERLAGSLRAAVSMTRRDYEAPVTPWHEMARRLPGHYFEATAARALVESAESAREEQAALELDRLLPGVLAGTGPRWLGAMADLAVVAARVGVPEQARSLYEALLPYQGRLVVWAGANTITGPVDEYLGQLAVRLGDLDHAVGHFSRAAALAERNGALPWLAQSLASRAGALASRAGALGSSGTGPDDLARAQVIAGRLGMRLPAVAEHQWRLDRDGEDWLLETGQERARLRDTRGLHYLRALLAVPGQEVPALDLVAGVSGVPAPAADQVLDDAARKAYLRRLDELRGTLDAADRAGDAERGRLAEAERDALLAELRQGTGLGGRSRAHPDAAERARVNVTRALWAAVGRVEAAAPLAGAHLRGSLRTGRVLRYQPSPGGPASWRT
jgi:tetratricopeptide (TPR) repeat protein